LGEANDTGRALGAVHTIGTVVDYRMGALGALFLGTIVWFINASHGPLGATTAALKQGAYTFLFGGFVVKACTSLSVGVRERWLGLATGCVVPTALAIGFTYLLHSLRGTPEPFASTVPTLVLAPPSFLAIGYLARRRESIAGSEETAR
jgi:hypothetical protein